MLGANPLVTAGQLQRFAPRCDFLALGPALDVACRAREINTPRRLKHFMGQVHHESRGLTRLEEDLNYSAKRLTEVWPSRFRTIEAARPYANNPRALANKVYGGRMGNVGPNDGWKFRGRSLIMNTGQDNYAEVGDMLGLDLVANPDLLATPRVAAMAAAAFWALNGLNRLADADDVVGLTVKINGGRNGLDDRRTQTQRAGLIWR